MFNACLVYCSLNGSRKTDDDRRRWAAGIWKGIYPDARIPPRAFDAEIDFDGVDTKAMDLIDREVRNFRKKTKGSPLARPAKNRVQGAMFA